MLETLTGTFNLIAMPPIPKDTEVGYWLNHTFQRGTVEEYIKDEDSYLIKHQPSGEINKIIDHDIWIIRNK